MWKYIGDGSSIPGIPSQDLPDAAFEEYAASYAAINRFPPDSAEKSGLWRHEDDKKAGKPAVSEGE